MLKLRFWVLVVVVAEVTLPILDLFPEAVEEVLEAIAEDFITLQPLEPLKLLP
jgi:hypothetical protein